MNKYLIFRKLKIILFLISLFSCYRVVAQSSASEKNFISPVPISLNLTKGKFKEVSEKVQNNPTYKEMKFVKVGRLDKIQKEGELLINIPDREVGIIAKANQVKFYNENNYEWYGAVNGGLGNAIILCKGGQITASITDGETNYEMHQGMTSGNAILYFSNPNISVHGCPIGVANTNHNARRVTETFPVMMAFRPAPVRPMAVNILGTAYGNAYTYYTWEASTACAINGVSSYEWRRSYDGVNYGSVVGTGEFFSEYLPCPFGNYYYLKVTVRDNANRVSEGFITIYINKGNCGARVEESSPSRSDETASNKPLFISEVSLGDAYPNPFSQTAYIRFALPKEDFVRLEILDIKGRVVQTLVEEKLSAGSHVREFEGKQLSNGIYLYRIWVGNHFTQTKKLSFSK